MRKVRNTAAAVLFTILAINGVPARADYSCDPPSYDQQGPICHVTDQCTWDGTNPYFNWNNWENSYDCSSFDYLDLNWWVHTYFNPFATVTSFSCQDAYPYTTGSFTIEWDQDGF